MSAADLKHTMSTSTFISKRTDWLSAMGQLPGRGSVPFQLRMHRVGRYQCSLPAGNCCRHSALACSTASGGGSGAGRSGCAPGVGAARNASGEKASLDMLPSGFRMLRCRSRPDEYYVGAVALADEVPQMQQQ